MPFKTVHCATAAAALLGLVASHAPASAFGSIGCNLLPEYYRAVGTIENGPYSCGMSMEEARRILARGENGEGAAQPPTPAPRKHHRRHKVPRY